MKGHLFKGGSLEKGHHFKGYRRGCFGEDAPSYSSGSATEQGNP